MPTNTSSALTALPWSQPSKPLHTEACERHPAARARCAPTLRQPKERAERRPTSNAPEELLQCQHVENGEPCRERAAVVTRVTTGNSTWLFETFAERTPVQDRRRIVISGHTKGTRETAPSSDPRTRSTKTKKHRDQVPSQPATKLNRHMTRPQTDCLGATWTARYLMPRRASRPRSHARHTNSTAISPQSRPRLRGQPTDGHIAH